MVEMPNIKKVLKVLQQNDAEFLGEQMKLIEEAVEPVMQRVYDTTPDQPLLNWGKWREASDRGKQLKWNYRAALFGLQLKSAGGGRRLGNNSAGIVLMNSDPRAAIFEIAGMGNGSRNKLNPGRSRGFRETLNQYHGAGPRLLVKAWREEKGITRAAKATYQAIEAMERRANEILSKDG
jgi:hypothetical protein